MKPPTLDRTNFLLQILFIAFLAAAPRGSRAAVNVVSYWRLGESDPVAAAGATATNTTDSVGGMNLTFQGNARYANDVATTAANCIGSLRSVNFTNSAYAISPIVSTATDNFGIECWAKPTALGGGQVIAYNGGTGGLAGSSGWGIILAADNTYQGLFGGITTIGTSPATANVWTHLALVCSSGVTTLYVNGVPSGSSSSGMYTPQGNFALGAPPQSPTSQFFTGLIDEVRVFTFAAGQFSTNDLLLDQFRTWFWTGPANDVWSNTNDWTRAADGVHGMPASGDTVNCISGHSVFYDDVNSMSLDSINVLSSSDPFHHVYLTVNSGNGGANTLTVTGAGVRDLLPNDSRYSLIWLSAGNSDIVHSGTRMVFANNASASTADSLSRVQYQLDGAQHYIATSGRPFSYGPGVMSFTENSTAGNAVISVNPATVVQTVDGPVALRAGLVAFTDNASGGNASIYLGGFYQYGLQNGGILQVSTLSSAGTTVGEVNGSGVINLGPKSLTVGSLNTDMSFSGLIQGVGGSIIKVGTGQIVLGGTNTYSGGTTLSNGSIVINNNAALGNSGAPLTIYSGAVDLRGYNPKIGALSGAGTIHNKSPGLASLSIGNGGNGGGTYAGTIVDHITTGGTVGLIVNGGVQTLAGANTYTGPTTINAGTLIVNGSLGTTPVTVAAGATLIVNGTIAGPVTVNGLLSGSGVLNGPLTNNAGGKVLITGGTFTVNNSIVNNGTFVLRGGAGLLSGGGSFLNNGTFDIITAGSVSLGSLVNQGTVLDATALSIFSVMNTGTNVVLSLNGYSDHTFQLQSSADLTSASFTNLGAPQSGVTGSTLTFTDSNVSSPQQFYRVFVNP